MTTAVLPLSPVAFAPSAPEAAPITWHLVLTPDRPSRRTPWVVSAYSPLRQNLACSARRRPLRGRYLPQR